MKCFCLYAYGGESKGAQSMKCHNEQRRSVLDYVTEQNPIARIICILNDIIKPEIKGGIIEAAKHYKVGCLELSDIDKSSGYPTKLGMQEIAQQVEAFLSK